MAKARLESFLFVVFNEVVMFSMGAPLQELPY